MSNLYNDAINYYSKISEVEIDDIKQVSKNTRFLSYLIAFYVHKDQKRVNNEPYINHPMNCMNLYEHLVGLDNASCNQDDLSKNQIPFLGIRECCLLHDVLEDSSYTIDDLRECFKQIKKEDYFNKYIADNLSTLTRKKDETYKEYISKFYLKENHSAALVKLIDIYDNANFLTIGDKLNDGYIKRMYEKYQYAYEIIKAQGYAELFANYNQNRKFK